MRLNQPVTGHEHPFPAGATLVSVTDIKGRITYCNEHFVKVSGFAVEDLMGQAHNIVRHPDMPAEAFRDMWATIQQGQAWTALVKNRRLNGDHYWVRANVTPMFAGEEIVGYLSVRSEPTRAEVQAAEALYRRMKEEEATGRPRLTLERGRLIDTSWAGRLRRTAERGLDAAGGAALWPGLLTLPLLASLPAAWPLPLRVGTGLATAVGLGLLTQFRTNRAL
ncbi:MAG: hypothetical protein RL722_1079, partial [Pseudomonadota bacterium]